MANDRRVKTEIIQLRRPLSHSRFLERFGYTLGDNIGEGSYSKVRIVDQWGIPPVQRLAVKIIDRSKASEEFVRRFLPRELEILPEIQQHPNIVTVHRILDTGSNVYIFMDKADGVLLELIQREGAQPEARAKWYFRQILSALQYLHDQEITHRDMKCENILMFPNHVLKLSDFGFSRRCSEGGRRLLSQTFCGSTAYAAPEILTGTPYNPKMYDVWSLGCVLFIMLTASMPFDDSNVRRMVQLQRERRINFPRRVEGLLSQTCKTLIRHMLEPDVCRRAMISQISAHPWLRAAPAVDQCQPAIHHDQVGLSQDV